MTIGRLSILLGLTTFGMGVVVLAFSLVVLPAQTPAALFVDGVLALLVSTLAVILGAVLLARRLLRPFRELAASVTSQQALALNGFLHSNIEELVAVASAIQRTEN